MYLAFRGIASFLDVRDIREFCTIQAKETSRIDRVQFEHMMR